MLQNSKSLKKPQTPNQTKPKIHQTKKTPTKTKKEQKVKNNIIKLQEIDCVPLKERYKHFWNVM